MFKIVTPNPDYNGIAHGVSFKNGVGQTDDPEVRDVLVNVYAYRDVTEETKKKRKGEQ